MALPFTTPLGEASALSRRLARNTQLILQEESGLGRVADPAGGAWAVEHLTRDLCQAAWAIFQDMEREGGLAAALRTGGFQAHVAKTRDAQANDFARRKRTITGVTDFPLLNGVRPQLGAASPRESLPAPNADAIAPLTWVRWSEPFEALRAKGDAKGNPGVFAANLGPLSEFSPRANFAQNLLGVGGVAVIGADTIYPDHAAMVAAFKTSGARVAVLCGADARYEREAGEAATALKTAGCDWLVFAGKPANEAALRAVGVDQFIFAGQNTLEALSTLHAALGV
jgi:methylmalonyl-CoA mutase